MHYKILFVGASIAWVVLMIWFFAIDWKRANTVFHHTKTVWLDHKGNEVQYYLSDEVKQNDLIVLDPDVWHLEDRVWKRWTAE